MKRITTLFFDIGGVCLTNGWDNVRREKSARHFSIDYEEMEKRHDPLFMKFEKGKLSLDKYLDEVVFFRRRNFSKEEFIEFMYSQSRAFNSTLKILQQLVKQNKYLLATINNESLELNQFRINKFKLYKYFKSFFSSCYMGVRKPEPKIYYKAVHILQKDPGECLFIDDNKENFQSAKTFGLNTILLNKPGELREKLEKLKIKI
jgi:putative hydrolase of the HAD superfamily